MLGLLGLNGFVDQERNQTVVKTNLQLLKLTFHVCNFKQASILFINYTVYIA